MSTAEIVSRSKYLAECQTNIALFKEEYPLHWVEYVRGKRPPNYDELMQLKKWTRNAAPFFTEGCELDIRSFAPLLHQLVDEKLHDCRRPRGVVVVAVVLEKLYISYSLCNFSAGERWNKHIGLWKAMRRIAHLKILPCPAIKVPELILADHEPDDFINWALQFPTSLTSAVERVLGRILHVDKFSDGPPFTDILNPKDRTC